MDQTAELSKLLEHTRARMLHCHLSNEQMRRLCDVLSDVAINDALKQSKYTTVRVKNESCVRYKAIEVVYFPVEFDGGHIKLRGNGVMPKDDAETYFGVSSCENIILTISELEELDMDDVNLDVTIHAVPFNPCKAIQTKRLHSVLNNPFFTNYGDKRGLQAPDVYITISSFGEISAYVNM